MGRINRQHSRKCYEGFVEHQAKINWVLVQDQTGKEKMIPVFVISLGDSKDRRETISKYLKVLDIPFEFVDAIDGRDEVSPEHEYLIDRKESRSLGRRMSNVEFACALSHLKTYQKIIKKEIPHALILEDDAIPTFELLPYLKGSYYEDAGITALGYRPGVYIRKNRSKILFGHFKSFIPRAPKPTYFRTEGAYGYVISKKAAELILKHAFPVTNVSDWPHCVSELHDKKEFRIVYPRLIYHSGDMKKSIIKKHMSYEETSRRIQPKFRLLRKVYYKLFFKKI